MTTRIIQREFVVQVGNDTLSDVTLAGAWSSFMNTYAVWPSGAGDSVTIRRNIVLQAGNYYVTGAVDNNGTVQINGQLVYFQGNWIAPNSRLQTEQLYNYDVGISRTEPGNSAVVNHPGGTMTIVISAVNTGGPRGVAVTISEYKRNTINTQSPAEIYRDGIRNTLGPPYVGALVWSTRSPATGIFARYQVTMPFRANITAHAWGAGGGGGGMDAGTVGGIGSSGLYNTTSFQVDKGDIVEVFVGSGGTGGGSSALGAGGGSPGSSRTSIDGDDTKSFNGGGGGRAGTARKGSSGGGGGGGGASGVLVNNIPTIVAGGGGGGGGAGNDGNSGSNYSRRDASINNNATGGYNPGSFALDITVGSSYTISSGVQVNNYTYFAPLTAPPIDSTVVVFGWGSIPAGAQTRTVTTNSKINLSSSSVLTFYVNKGTESDWGQIPDSGEQLTLQYSTNGSTWVTIETVPVNVTRNTWLVRSPQIPAGAKVAGGVFLRFRQTTNGDAHNKRDTWAFTSLLVGSPTLDFRGEHAQDKSGDGGGGGAGGGGYPGGQGGTTPGGDSSAYAGQCGGNYPDNTGATTGSSTDYYKSGYADGGNRGGGTGQSGRVVLLIEPLGLVSVKIADEWKQSQESFVKVSGSWRDIDTIYIKINDTWRQINGSGQGDVALVGNSQSYGTSLRSFS